ncbi:molybdate ABC transporter substrate-binding protein [Curvivirga aplysinae]|uniref:molybdate ABC transporter substrate-binding protein n=1 Tax=Curvivirga aplysinae TaxID=2529852 RepID=UPI001C3FDC81|nr:molybdate ABC transporter substrate-binding protein [Curvivirga aplysinae]
MTLFNSKIIAVIASFIGGISVAKAETPPTVFAAASLTAALDEIAQSKKIKPQFSFASSGALARQIASGAPADIFISANIKWADWLKTTTSDIIVNEKTFLSNSLAVVSYQPQTQTIKKLFQNENDFFVAIGDPTHTPAGIYAKQSLEYLNLWKELTNKLAPSSNVRAALYLVQSGAADYGIVYKSDALNAQNIHLVDILPKNSHEPILYQALLLKQDNQINAKATSLFDNLSDTDAITIWKKFGFQPLKN